MQIQNYSVSRLSVRRSLEDVKRVFHFEREPHDMTETAKIALRKRRVLLAFLIAPLWVPCLMVLFVLAVADLSRPADRDFFVWMVMTGTAFSYGGAMLLGLPLFWALVSYQKTAFWHAPVVGIVAAWITIFVFLTIVFPIMLDGWSAFSFSGTLDQFLNASGFSLHEMVTLLACSGGLGVLVGSTFWLIARPDRA